MEIGSVIEFDNWEMYKNIENEKLFYLPFMKNNKYKTVMYQSGRNRDNLLKYLIDNNIYCNVHWRLDERKQNSDIRYLSDSVITIPCDQRYKEEEMDYIANILEHWEKR